MPKSKRSAKRRAKLKKQQNKTYNWAMRKVRNLTPEQWEQFMKAAQLELAPRDNEETENNNNDL